MFCIDVINQLVSALLVKATKPTMKQHLNIRKILNSLALCAIMLMCPAVHGQNRADDCLLIKEVSMTEHSSLIRDLKKNFPDFTSN